MTWIEIVLWGLLVAIVTVVLVKPEWRKIALLGAGALLGAIGVAWAQRRTLDGPDLHELPPPDKPDGRPAGLEEDTLDDTPPELYRERLLDSVPDAPDGDPAARASAALERARLARLAAERRDRASADD